MQLQKLQKLHPSRQSLVLSLSTFTPPPSLWQMQLCVACCGLLRDDVNESWGQGRAASRRVTLTCMRVMFLYRYWLLMSLVAYRFGSNRGSSHTDSIGPKYTEFQKFHMKFWYVCFLVHTFNVFYAAPGDIQGCWVCLSWMEKANLHPETCIPLYIISNYS